MELSSGCSLCTNFVLQKDCLDLRPCGCVLCKDCFIKLLWEMRGKETIACPSCSASVLDHGFSAMDAYPAITAGPIMFPSPAIPQPPRANPLFRATTTMTSQIANNPNERDIPHADEKPVNVTRLPRQIAGAYDEVANGDEVVAFAAEQQQKASPLGDAPNPHKKRKKAPSTASCSTDYKPFDERLHELTQIQHEHGTLKVSYCKYPGLSSWVSAVRSERQSVTPAQRIQLESIGFYDELCGRRRPRTYRKRKTFDDRLEALVAYKEHHGDCAVPYQYTPDPSLGEWVKDVRRGHVQVTYEQRKSLTSIGFNWETRHNARDREWKVRLRRLERYQQRFGHCEVPSAWKEDKQLSQWCSTQRKINRKGSMRADRKRALDELGFGWRADRRSTVGIP